MLIAIGAASCHSVHVSVGSEFVIEGEGMPHYRSPFDKGNLIIKFDVQFPDVLVASLADIKVSYAVVTE